MVASENLWLNLICTFPCVAEESSVVCKPLYLLTGSCVLFLVHLVRQMQSEALWQYHYLELVRNARSQATGFKPMFLWDLLIISTSLMFRPAALTDPAQCSWEVGSDMSRSRPPGLTCQWCWPRPAEWWLWCSCDVRRGMAHPGPCAPREDGTPDPGLCWR